MTTDFSPPAHNFSLDSVKSTVVCFRSSILHCCNVCGRKVPWSSNERRRRRVSKRRTPEVALLVVSVPLRTARWRTARLANYFCWQDYCWRRSPAILVHGSYSGRCLVAFFSWHCFCGARSQKQHFCSQLQSLSRRPSPAKPALFRAARKQCKSATRHLSTSFPKHCQRRHQHGGLRHPEGFGVAVL